MDVCICTQSFSHVWLSVTPWTAACQSLCAWDFSGKDTGVGCHFLLQGIFLTHGLNSCLLHWQVDSLPLSHLGNPESFLIVLNRFQCLLFFFSYLDLFLFLLPYCPVFYSVKCWMWSCLNVPFECECFLIMLFTNSLKRKDCISWECVLLLQWKRWKACLL